jgi:hypothetical protein
MRMTFSACHGAVRYLDLAGVFERGPFDEVPSMRAPNLLALQRSLENGGAIFLAAGDNRPGGDGVRFKV